MHLLQTVAHSGIHGTVRDRTMAYARPTTSSSDLRPSEALSTFTRCGNLATEKLCLACAWWVRSDALSTRSSWRMTFRFRHGIPLQFRPLSTLEGCGNCCIDQPLLRSGRPHSRERRGNNANSHNAHSEGLVHRATPAFL